MKLVIAGGTGLIGQALVSLFSTEHEIVVLSRTDQTLPGARIEVWDAINPGKWVSDVRDADILINLAGAGIFGDGLMPKRWTSRRKELIRSSRINSVELLNRILEKQEKPITWIQASAIGFYGNRGNEILTEDSNNGDDFLAEVCLGLESEMKSQNPVVREIVLWLGVVLSENGGAFPLLALPYKLVGGGPMGGGSQFISWIHIEDVIHSIQYLIQKTEEEGLFNLTAPNPISNREINQALGRITGRISFLPIPGFIMKLAIGGSAATILDSQRVLPKRLLDAGYQFEFTNIDQALKALLK